MSGGNPVMAARVEALVARFCEIDETTMRGLPLHNSKLAVEAVGFRPWGDGWIGVLITPWFMNVLILDSAPKPMDYNAIGRRSTVALPAGERKFETGGDPSLGLYRQYSLHSPVFGFGFQDAARVEAEARLAELLEPSTGSGTQPKIDTARPLDRRSFLFGARSL